MESDNKNTKHWSMKNVQQANSICETANIIKLPIEGHLALSC